MSPRLVGVVERGVFKPLGHVHLHGTDPVFGSGANAPGVAAHSSILVEPAHAAGKTTNGATGVPSLRPVAPKVSWLDEHRHGDEGESDVPS